MTASERLAALEIGDGLTPYRLEDALPEIVAAVQEAERLFPDGKTLRLANALAALDAKLERSEPDVG